ncbi:ABC transporter substrate-binding protein [Devosia sp. BSSL-BM10]|uniref:ABC transporter substrate-binding protein n=1 Tax=Devosia litorisediminis TaxID=2829817 RepID=A0A942EH30_9HYPH|nr:ABC transporter substrate-binding protein [Devosia litorisediminis]MBS3849826.1 ABC transporter substrate-binding protein [Devosia litorisediminis]
MRKIALGVSIVAMLATGVAQAQDPAATEFRKGFLAGSLDWSAVAERAKSEGTVNLYYWGGSDPLNVWMDSIVAPAMAELGVTLNPVRITGTKDAVDLVLAELGSGKMVGEGSVDAIWLNGENFSTLKKQDALFGAFAPLLPNAKNIEWDETDPRSLLNLRDFGVLTGGAEVPWSGEQYVCAVNADRVSAEDVPHSFDGLQTYLEANPGKFIYVKPPHYIGNTFVQEAVYAHNPDGTGAAPFQQSLDELGAAELARLIAPGLEYLKNIEPLLLGGDSGTPRYPEDSNALDGLFLNGEVNFNCKFGLYAVATGLSQGTYPEAAQEFVFPEGNMIKNKNYLAIPANAPNPGAALVLADYMSTVEAQISKLEFTGMPAGIDPWLLSDEDAAALAAASPGHTGLQAADLDANIAPDTNATLVDVIEATWLEYIERDSTDSIETIVTRAAENLNQ